MDPKEKQQPVTYVSGLGYLPATPKLTERRNLTLRYHLVILSTMLVLGLWLVLLPPFQALMVRLGLSAWEGELAARIPTLLFCYLPAMLILWLCGHRSKGVLGAKKAIGIRYGYALGLGLGISAIARLLTTGGLWLMSVCTPFYYQHQIPPLPDSFSSLLLELAALVLLPSVLEELFFRGLVMGRLKEYGELVAVLVSSVLYAILSPALDQLVFRLFLGLVLGLARLQELFGAGAYGGQRRGEPCLALPGLAFPSLLSGGSAAVIAGRDGGGGPLVRQAPAGLPKPGPGHQPHQPSQDQPVNYQLFFLDSIDSRDDLPGFQNSNHRLTHPKRRRIYG